MRLHLITTATFLFVVQSATSVLASGETRQLDAHEHGHAKLEIAIDGSVLTIGLEVPGESIVGFEHKAKTEKQKQSVKAAQEKLSDASAIFTLPEGAGCKIKSAEAELHQHGKHNEFEASYAFTCSKIGSLTSLRTNLFSLYPAIEEIDVQYATPAGQGATELEADSVVVTFPSNS